MLYFVVYLNKKTSDFLCRPLCTLSIFWWPCPFFYSESKIPPPPCRQDWPERCKVSDWAGSSLLMTCNSCGLLLSEFTSPHYRLRRHCHHQARDVHPVLIWGRSFVYDGGPTSSQHWVNVSCLPRYHTWAALKSAFHLLIAATYFK